MGFSAKVGSFNIDPAVTVGNTQAITGVGFQPKIVLFFWGGSTGTGDTVAGGTYNIGFGAAIDSTHRFAINALSEDGQASSDTGRSHFVTEIMRAYTDTATLDGIMDFSSMDAGGFTLIVDDQFTQAYRISYLALGGTDLTNVFISTQASPAGLGNYNVTGVGFQPDAMLMAACYSYPTYSATGMICGLGMATGSSNQGIATAYAVDAQATMDTFGYGYNGEVFSMSTTAYREAFVSFGADGFTLNKLEGGAYTYSYICLKGGQYLVSDLTTRTDGNDIAETVGFQPVALLFASANHALDTQNVATANARFSIGAASSTSARACAAMSDEDNLADSETAFANYDSAVYAHVKDDAIEALMDLKSIQSDGFTCVMDDTETAGCWVTYLAIGATAASPSASPSGSPSASPSHSPSASPSEGTPSASPSHSPSASPSEGTPSASPSEGTPSASPSEGTPSASPSEGTPSASPSEGTPSASPSEGTPSASPSEGTPSASPSEGTPSASPSEGTPSASPSEGTPSASPSEGTPSASPSEGTPSASPSEGTPSASPSEGTPSASPSEGTPSASPSEGTPSASPSEGTPSASPSEGTPSASPSEGTPSASPSEGTPSASPSEGTPSASPSEGTPSASPSEGTPSASPSEGTPSASPSEGTPSASPSEGTPSASPSEGTPSASPSEGTPSASPSASSKPPEQCPVCWGHVTGVAETVLTFTGNWTGTGAIAGAGDAEAIELNAGEYMVSEIVDTGSTTVTLEQNHYDPSGDDVGMNYRHGATIAACYHAAWIDYVAPFVSLGYIQVRLTSTL